MVSTRAAVCGEVVSQSNLGGEPRGVDPGDEGVVGESVQESRNMTGTDEYRFGNC
jgi:hypothetical protein